MFQEAEKYYNRELPKRIIGYFTEFLFGAWLIWKNKKNKFIGMKITR